VQRVLNFILESIQVIIELFNIVTSVIPPYDGKLAHLQKERVVYQMRADHPRSHIFVTFTCEILMSASISGDPVESYDPMQVSPVKRYTNKDMT